MIEFLEISGSFSRYKKNPEIFRDPNFSMFSIDFGFLVDFIPKVVSGYFMILMWVEAGHRNKLLYFGKDSAHVLDTTKSSFLGNIPRRSALHEC